MKKRLVTVGGAVVAVALTLGGLACSSNPAKPSASAGSSGTTKQLTFGYISPGPDTWYQRDVQGFEYAAKQYGVKVDVLNSQYDQQKEIQNIQTLVGQGVNGLSMFSYDDNGAIMAAQQGLKAKIPVVLTDNVGDAISKGAKLAASVDFDWCGMGKSYADYMAQNWPGQNFAVIAGNFEAPPTNDLDSCMLKEANKLGKNKEVFLQQTMYNTATAVNLAQDLVASGKKFGILFVMNDDMGAAVAQVLQQKGLLSKIHLMTQNGSNVGLQMMQKGQLQYTISSSPAWEGMVAFLELYAAATGHLSPTANKEVILPVMPVTPGSAVNPMKVVPWTPESLDWTLTRQYFPTLIPAAPGK